MYGFLWENLIPNVCSGTWTWHYHAGRPFMLIFSPFWTAHLLSLSSLKNYKQSHPCFSPSSTFVIHSKIMSILWFRCVRSGTNQIHSKLHFIKKRTLNFYFTFLNKRGNNHFQPLPLTRCELSPASCAMPVRVDLRMLSMGHYGCSQCLCLLLSIKRGEDDAHSLQRLGLWRHRASWFHNDI